MMDQKRIAMALIVIGLVVGLVGLLADVIGLGQDEDTFGTLQIAATVVGVVVLLAGVGFYYYGDRFMGAKSTAESTEEGPGEGEA
jgi:protein-S-isoprenylcysteine O-methyltransferase Ste14